MVYRHIGGIAAIRQGKPPAANRILRGVEGVPPASDVGLEPRVQVHGFKTVKESDYKPGRDADAPAQCDAKVGEVTAYPMTL
jgi:hypothetical protein